MLRPRARSASSFNLPVTDSRGSVGVADAQAHQSAQRGDVVTHMFAAPPNSIIDDSGHILPSACRPPARRRFDVGNGQTASAVGHVERISCRRDSGPHVVPPLEVNRPDWCHRLPQCMSKFLGSACRLPGGRVRHRESLAHLRGVSRPRPLNVGAPADVAVLELGRGRSSPRQLWNKRAGRQRLFGGPCLGASGFRAHRCDGPTLFWSGHDRSSGQ